MRAILLCFFFCAWGAQANTTDSTVQTNVYQVNTWGAAVEAIDTAVEGLHTQLPGNTWDNPYRVLSNYGGVAMPLIAPLQSAIGIRTGRSNYHPYQYQLETVPHYSVRRPFVELKMLVGANQLNQFEGGHGQQVNKRVGYGLDFRRINSPGFYANDRKRHNAVRGYLHYQDSIGRYESFHHLVFNKNQSAENGGLINNPLENEGRIERFDFLAVASNDADYQYNDLALESRHILHLGPSTITRINDSTQWEQVQPKLSVQVASRYFKEAALFSDRAKVDSLRYYRGYELARRDSIYQQHRLDVFEQSVGIASPYFRWSGQQKIYLPVVFHAEAQFRIALWDQMWRRDTRLQENRVKAFFGSNPHKEQSFRFGAHADFVLNGAGTTGDLDLKGFVEQQTERYGRWRAEGGITNSSAALLYQRLINDTFSWQADLKDQQIVHVGGQYQYKDYLQLSAQFKQVNNLHYYDAAWQAQNYPSLQWLHLRAATHLQAGKWHFEGQVDLQVSDSGAPVYVPRWMLHGRVYYQGSLFKGLMMSRIGLQAQYVSDFAHGAYSPLLQSYFHETQPLGKQAPQVDAFLHLKVRTVRFLLHLNSVELLASGRTHALAAPYYAPPFHWYFGIQWRFLD